MHRHHDLDLLAALAEGRLSDTAPADRLVASCAECAEIYHSHRLVLETVAAEPAPRLDDLERQRLRAAVWEGLGADQARSSPGSRPSTPWWYRIAPVAAVLVVAVGVASVFTGGSGQEGTLQTLDAVSSDAPTAEEDTAAGQVAPEAFSADTAPATTAASDDTMTPLADGADEEVTQAAAGAGAFSLAEVETAAEEFEERVEAGELEPGRRFDLDCPAPGEVSDPVLAVETAMVEGDDVWFVAYGAGREVTAVAVYRQTDCTTVFRSG